MSNCKKTPTLVIIGLKLSKDHDGLTVDPTLFKRLVGSLMFLIATRPNMMHGVSMISRFMESPKDSHWKAGKIILRYVSGTKDLVIMYSTSKNLKLIEYTDNDNGGNTDDRKNTSRYTFNFGTGVVLWDSKKQPILTLSLVEEEYVTATSITFQVFWMRIMLRYLS